MVRIERFCDTPSAERTKNMFSPLFPLRLFLSPTCFLGPFVFFLQQSRKIWMMDGWSSALDNVLDMDLQTAGNEEKCQAFFFSG